MKGTTGTQDYLKQNNKVDMTCTLTAELNMNRYHSIYDFETSIYGATNVPLFNGETSTSNYTEYYKNRFTAEHICRPDRPTSGIYYARLLNASAIAAGDPNNVPTWKDNAVYNTPSSSYTATLSNGLYTLKPRYYFPSSDNYYKYFTGASKTVTVPAYYKDQFWCNKIVVCFEVTDGRPTSFTIDIGVNNTQGSGSNTWTTIGTTAASRPSGNTVSAVNISADSTTGRVVLYRLSDGTWSTTRPTTPVIDSCIKINSIRVSTTAMSNTETRTSIIEISPRIEVDLSSRLIDWSTDMSISDGDELNIVGISSSNSGDLKLNNVDQQLNDRNRSTSVATVAELNRKWTEFRLDININSEVIRQFTMIGDEWEVSDEAEASVKLFDFASVLQEKQCPPLLIGGVTPTQAIWRILDLCGVNNVKIKKDIQSSSIYEPIIDQYFCDIESTVWQSIQEICKSFNYVTYIDEYGNIVIANKYCIYAGANDTRTSSWTFRGQKDGLELADIVSYSESIGDVVNLININYTGISSRSRGPNPDEKTVSYGPKTIANVQLSTRTLYRPEKDRLLGQSVLVASINSTQDYCYITTQSITDSWWGAFSGYALIDNELIKYDGLEFTYYSPTDAQQKTVVIKSPDELKNLTYTDALGQINFTGRLCNLQRGQLGTTAASHSTQTSSWVKVNGLGKTENVILGTNASTGELKRYFAISGESKKLVTATRDLTGLYTMANGAAPSYIANAWIDKNYPERKAGMILFAEKDSNNRIKSGIKIMLDSSSDTENRVVISEIRNYAVVASTMKKVSIPCNYGEQFYNIEQDFGATIYSLNVKGKRNWRIAYIYVGSTLVATFDFNPALYPSLNSVALFVDGNSRASFKYFGATNNVEDFWKEFRYAESRLIKSLLDYNGKYIDDTNIYYEKFGSIIREVYLDTVKFTKFPARNLDWYPIYNAGGEKKVAYDGQDVYIAKPSDVASAISFASPFRATFIIANAGNRSVLLGGGSDAGTYPLIYGSLVERQNNITVEKRDTDSIARIGEKKYDSSPLWITNKDAAEKTAQWVLDWQKNGILTSKIKLFNNPLASLLDLVSIKFDRMNITTSDKFIINNISNSWSASSGLETNIKLVRV